jgi:hypothetical protein
MFVKLLSLPARPIYLLPRLAATILTLLLMSGLVFPRFSASLGAAYVVGRELYSYSYTAYGADTRLGGAILIDAALVLLLGGSVGSGLSILGYIS